jgi:hypothetical protein
MGGHLRVLPKRGGAELDVMMCPIFRETHAPSNFADLRAES